MSAVPTLAEIEAAARIVHAHMPPTPQYCWPLLCEALGTEVWVKHENQTPVGAFKIRGGLVHFARLHGIPATIVVPHGNSREKNTAMRALGVELIEHGEDFQASREHAGMLADTRGLRMVASFHEDLVTGVATYALELLRAVADVDVVYVPIGLGSGICGMLAVRDALGLTTEVVGVVSAHAPAYALSFTAGEAVDAPALTAIADGMACQTPEPDALARIRRGVSRVVEVTDDEVRAAMRLLFETTHNVAEGAGAAAVAAASQERARNSGRRVAVVLSGGNVDREVFADVLGGEGASRVTDG